jgi:glycosyltransferase involved in cell wall biosynthesis
VTTHVGLCYLIRVAGKIAWVFSLGHGHQAQFLNFKEACPESLSDRSLWVGMDFTSSGDILSKLEFVPDYLRRRRNEIWHLKQIFRQGVDKEDALFLASWNLRLVPYMRRYRSYLYVDFSPSLMRSLSPWYDHFHKHPLAQAVREALATWLPRSARGVFTMSEWCANGIVADYGIPRDRIHSVLPGANLRRWHFVDRSERSGGPVRILMVGGEFLRKGGDLLLEWAEKTQRKDVKVDIVTWPGQLPERVRTTMGPLPADGKLSASLGDWLPNVTVHCGFPPNSPQLLELFDKADIFCLPTRGDFSSIASLEAMAMGLPVIVGAVGGIPELIEEGKTGFLVPPGDAEALNDRLERLIEDRALRLSVGRAARLACEQRLNIERQLLEIAAVMDREDPRRAQARSAVL